MMTIGAGFVRRTGLVAAGQASVKATQLVLAVVLVRLLSPDAWTEVAFLLTIYLAGTTIGTLNVHQGIIFFLPRVDADRRRSLVHRSMALLLGVGALSALALTLAAPALSGGRLGDAGVVPWLGVAIAVELPAACVATTMIATNRFSGAALWDVAGSVMVIAATVIPAKADAGTVGIVGGLVVVGSVRLVLGVVAVDRVLAGPARPAALGLVAAQLRYGLPLGVAVAVAMLNRLVDKWFVAAFHSGDFGVYVVAAQEIPLLAVLPYAGGAALVSSLVDAFRDGDLGLARTHWLHLTATMSRVVVPLGAALVVAAPELIEIVFTAEFVAGVLPFQLFTLMTLHRVAEYGMLLRAAGRTRDLLAVAAVTLVANTALAGTGAYVGGMVGAAAGTLIATGIGWWFVLGKVADALQVPVRDAFAWRSWLSCVAIASVAALVAQSVTSILAADGSLRLVVKMATYITLIVLGLRWWARSPHSALPAAVVVPEVPVRVSGSSR